METKNKRQTPRGIFTLGQLVQIGGKFFLDGVSYAKISAFIKDGAYEKVILKSLVNPQNRVKLPINAILDAKLSINPFRYTSGFDKYKGCYHSIFSRETFGDYDKACSIKVGSKMERCSFVIVGFKRPESNRCSDTIAAEDVNNHSIHYFTVDYFLG